MVLDKVAACRPDPRGPAHPWTTAVIASPVIPRLRKRREAERVQLNELTAFVALAEQLNFTGTAMKFGTGGAARLSARPTVKSVIERTSSESSGVDRTTGARLTGRAADAATRPF